MPLQCRDHGRRLTCCLPLIHGLRDVFAKPAIDLMLTLEALYLVLGMGEDTVYGSFAADTLYLLGQFKGL